jgi:hypothetical protein
MKCNGIAMSVITLAIGFSAYTPWVKEYPNPTNIPKNVLSVRYFVACDLLGIENKNREQAKNKKKFSSVDMAG